jgi:hypothetical protein
MIGTMNPESFLVELKELHRNADWHRRYHGEQARRYCRIDYWMRVILGIGALVGAGLSTNEDLRIAGAILAGACGFIIANVLPLFKWDEIISGLNEAENEWTRIFKGYANVLSFFEISDRGEMLVQEFQRVKEMQAAVALSDKRLPVNKKLLKEKEMETREYYAGCDPNP